MDGYQTYADSRIDRLPAAPHGAAGAPRSFLFLQGPISNFFDRLGRALIARGHRVHRVNLHFGDQLFWRLPATHFRGRFEEWREFVGGLLDRHQITDLVLHGDRRPYHVVAAEEARVRGIPVIATDLGYLRPDWLTLEYDGMSTYSRFPRDPEAIRSLAARFPEPELGPRFQTPFWLIASRDIAYNLGLVLGRPLYPHYRYHSVCHPFLEYLGWLRSRPAKRLSAGATAEAKQQLQAEPGSYFLVPLQLQTDYQIRAHSPFLDLRDAVREIVVSFAAGGSRRRLVLVVHPLDNGLIDWRRLVAELARQMGVADRVFALDGGTPTDLLRNAAGVVTVNSTVGITALCHGVPVKVLGSAVFDVPGLTCQAPLAAFWHAPPRPDPALLAAFLRALVGTTQVKGGYYERSSQDCAIAGFIERLEQRPYPLPPLAATALAARLPRAASRTVAVTGASGAIGAALARGAAGLGTRLCLIGAMPETLAQTAEDCRQRGARVETIPAAQAGGADQLVAVDRAAAVDLIVVNADGAGDPVRDIGAAMGAVAAVAEKMRRRGAGSIVLVSSLAGRPLAGDPREARRAAKAWRAYAASLRRRLRADGVAVAVVVPGAVATWAAARLSEPRLAVAGADRIAERVGRGVARHRAIIAVPGAVTVLGRALRLLTARARQMLRKALSPPVTDIAEPADDAPFAGESATGD